jgi:uncharacterized membrane protein YczE
MEKGKIIAFMFVAYGLYCVVYGCAKFLEAGSLGGGHIEALWYVLSGMFSFSFGLASIIYAASMLKDLKK